MPVTEVEERVARLEGRIDEHSRFFESINVKLTLLEDKGDRNREELERKIETVRIEGNRNREELERKIETVRREMSTNFRWIVGIQITTWITVLLAILFKK